MNLFVLDTDMLTLVQEGHPAASRRFLSEPSEALAITVLTVEEQLSGWYTQARKAKPTTRINDSRERCFAEYKNCLPKSILIVPLFIYLSLVIAPFVQA